MDDITPADYARLPFPELLAYLEGKANLDTDSWRDGMGVVQDAAFTVARAKGQLLQEIRDALERAVNDGQGVNQFVQVFDTIASRWSASWPLKGSTGWRGQLIYEQNLRQAYAAGRHRQMTEPETVRRRPYWQWRHGGSFAPRPAHLAMDGRVYPADSLPFFVPAGFGCQCSVVSLSQRDVDREGLTVENLTLGQELTYRDPNTNQQRTTTLQPDEGFDRIPGSLDADQRRQLIANLAPDIQALILQEIGDD